MLFCENIKKRKNKMIMKIGVMQYLSMVAVLEMGHSIFQRLRTFGGHLVTEEGDLGCSEDALRWVDDDPVPLELGEESS
jgi:hypothetical protein